jgi:hypothetical protein
MGNPGSAREARSPDVLGDLPSNATAGSRGRQEGSRCLIGEVLEDLVRTRPIPGWDDEIDVTATEPVQGPVSDAAGRNVQFAEAIAPCQRRGLLLERADRLPSPKTGIAYRYRGLLRPRGPAEQRHLTRVRG